jgi:hypothetical protein
MPLWSFRRERSEVRNLKKQPIAKKRFLAFGSKSQFSDTPLISKATSGLTRIFKVQQSDYQVKGHPRLTYYLKIIRTPLSVIGSARICGNPRWIKSLT